MEIIRLVAKPMDLVITQKPPAKQTIARTIIVSGGVSIVGLLGYLFIFHTRGKHLTHVWPWLQTHSEGLACIVGLAEIVTGLILFILVCEIIRWLFKTANWG